MYLHADQILHDIQNDRIRLHNFQEDHTAWSDSEKEHADKVTLAYEQVAFLVRKKLVKEKHVRDEHGPTFVAVWNKVEAYIEWCRVVTDSPRRRIHFQELAKRFAKKPKT